MLWILNLWGANGEWATVKKCLFIEDIKGTNVIAVHTTWETSLYTIQHWWKSNKHYNFENVDMFL